MRLARVWDRLRSSRVGTPSFFISKECIFIEMHHKNIPKYTKHVQITLKSITNKRENKKNTLS